MRPKPSTADEILTYARTLLISGGYNGFSYADIANEVGIRKASIHHHFPTKADLVRTLVSRYRQDALAGIAEMERHVGNPVSLLRSYADYWRACIADATDPFCVCAMLAAELPCLPKEVADEVTAHFRALSTWIISVLERGAEQNLLRIETSPGVDAEAFMATVLDRLDVRRGTPVATPRVTTS